VIVSVCDDDVTYKVCAVRHIFLLECAAAFDEAGVPVICCSLNHIVSTTPLTAIATAVVYILHTHYSGASLSCLTTCILPLVYARTA
jgi:hypothetical protein